MANTDPQAVQDAQLAYERSNASLKDYDPAKQEALDLAWVAATGGPNTHPQEPVLTTAENSPTVIVDPAPPSTGGSVSTSNSSTSTTSSSK